MDELLVTYPLLNFLNGGLITALLLMTQCRPIRTFARSPRTIESDMTMVWKYRIMWSTKNVHCIACQTKTYMYSVNFIRIGSLTANTLYTIILLVMIASFIQEWRHSHWILSCAIQSWDFAPDLYCTHRIECIIHVWTWNELQPST